MLLSPFCIVACAGYLCYPRHRTLRGTGLAIQRAVKTLEERAKNRSGVGVNKRCEHAQREGVWHVLRIPSEENDNFLNYRCVCLVELGVMDFAISSCSETLFLLHSSVLFCVVLADVS